MKWFKTTPFPTTYCLITTLDPYKKWCKRNKIVPDTISDEDVGAVLTHGSYCFVYITPGVKNKWELFDTIVHESVHVFQESVAYVVEEKPGIEAEAYQIAAIATNLLKEYYALDEKREEGL